ncbi:MAG: orotate phosphoribosyltransferase [Pseudomonadota bacterium]
MKNYQAAFLELCVELEILKFGQFTLKSGRESPYFFNAGLFYTGLSLDALGNAYAHTLADSELDFDLLFGPAYKGITLACATAIACSRHFGMDVPIAYDRKEVKDHGEGGQMVGAPLAGKRVVIIDDVISSGTSIRLAAEQIDAAGATLAGVALALDRQERGLTEESASAEIVRRYEVPVISILSLDTLIEYLGRTRGAEKRRKQIVQYRALYGTNADPG